MIKKKRRPVVKPNRNLQTGKRPLRKKNVKALDEPLIKFAKTKRQELKRKHSQERGCEKLRRRKDDSKNNRAVT